MSDILTVDELASLEADKRLYQKQIDDYQRLVDDIDDKLAAHRQAIGEQQAGMSYGALLVMTEEAQTLIGTNNHDMDTPYGTLRIWPVGSVVKFVFVADFGSGPSAHIEQTREFAPVTVGGIPLEILRAMRQVYLERMEKLRNPNQVSES